MKPMMGRTDIIIMLIRHSKVVDLALAGYMPSSVYTFGQVSSVFGLVLRICLLISLCAYLTASSWQSRVRILVWPTSALSHSLSLPLILFYFEWYGNWSIRNFAMGTYSWYLAINGDKDCDEGGSWHCCDGCLRLNVCCISWWHETSPDSEVSHGAIATSVNKKKGNWSNPFL